jgi:diamine N-acetyltransferase
MISLKNASVQDIPSIQQLAAKIWAEHYTPIIGEAQIDYMLGLFYSEKSLSAQMSEGQVFYLIENEGLIEGFLSVTIKDEEEFFIHKFYVDARGKGMGKKVFEMLLSFSPQTKTIRLNVNKHNFKSINFYFKLGFQIENTAVFDIGNGYVMDDFRMVWKS